MTGLLFRGEMTFSHRRKANRVAVLRASQLASAPLTAAQKVKCNLLINTDSSERKIYKAMDMAVGAALLVDNYIIGLTVR